MSAIGFQPLEPRVPKTCIRRSRPCSSEKRSGESRGGVGIATRSRVSGDDHSVVDSHEHHSHHTLLSLKALHYKVELMNHATSLLHASARLDAMSRSRRTNP